jgi:hypothetical protein
MPPRASRADTLAQRLLDAQVAYHLDRFTGDRLESTVAGLVESLLDTAGPHQLADLIDREAVAAVVVRAMANVPGSAAVSGIVEMGTQVAHDGPWQPFPVGETVDREQVEVLVTSVLELTPALERALERLTGSPLVGVVASRFMGRIASEVIQANQAVASKVPGLGPLVSFGTSAASRLRGAADRQFEGLIDDAVGKGGTFAVRRLNRIFVETLRDPTTREAILQVWHQTSGERVIGLGAYAAHAEVSGVVDAAHELAVTALGTEHATLVVDALFEWFGGYTLAELLDQLEWPRDEVIAHLVPLASFVVDTLRASGDLERLLRAQLEPFYASAEVADLLR